MFYTLIDINNDSGNKYIWNDFNYPPQNWGKNGGQGVWKFKLGSIKFNKKNFGLKEILGSVSGTWNFYQ